MIKGSKGDDMGIFDSLKHQLIDIIEWNDNSTDTMAYRFPRYENEIKNSAKLIVRESQSAVFVNEGQIADVFNPGTYTLQTQNLPILANLKGWKYGFESPFKAEVYFVSTRIFTDRKFGTKNPIMLRDSEFGMVRLRAFGNFSIRISDPGVFVKQISGTGGCFTLDQLDDQLRDMVGARFADALGQSKIAALDLAGNYDQLGQYITSRIQNDFQPYGLTLVNLFVENISLPQEVEAAMDKRTSMGVIGNLQAYTQYQTANAIPEAAASSGGLPGAAAGMVMGMNMGNQIASGMNANQQMPPPGPPPLAKPSSYYIATNGQQNGPFETQSLTDKITSGQLTRQTLVWKQGMPQWTEAEKVPELASLFAGSPPPLPKG
jgi:membrane protease subunit (stomatin/prohibitin family)